MLDRRQSARDKVIYGGVADIDERGGSRECVVRNISETGAHLERHGKALWFCSEGCKREFAENPDGFPTPA